MQVWELECMKTSSYSVHKHYGILLRKLAAYGQMHSLLEEELVGWPCPESSVEWSYIQLANT